MLFIVDTLPDYCPQCGRNQAAAWREPHTRREAQAKASLSCECGAKWQLVSRAALLKAAEADGGDLHRYA